MKQTQRSSDWQEVSKRAAEVRRKWTSVEKARRLGLPPDVPVRLKDFILSPRTQWVPALCVVSGK